MEAYRCKICDKQFKNAHGVHLHLLLKHKKHGKWDACKEFAEKITTKAPKTKAKTKTETVKEKKVTKGYTVGKLTAKLNEQTIVLEIPIKLEVPVLLGQVTIHQLDK